MAAVAVGVEDIEVGFEEAMSWLPSHVLDEAILWERERERESNHNKKDDVKYHYQRRHRSKFPTDHHEPFPAPHSKASTRRHHQKPRYSGNWASGGPGMQAFFLDSGRKSCGTGVFLPQRDYSTRSSRPACSPVLLPSRVVQALNLNVHELGLQISPRRDPLNNNTTTTTRGGNLNSLKNKNGKDNVSTRRCVTVTQNENGSPSPETEIFLPKEWTY